MPKLTVRTCRIIGASLLVALSVSGCSTSTTELVPESASESRPASPEDETLAPERPETATAPQPFIQAGPVGSAESYAALIEQLETELSPELLDEVPWPDLRSPDPVDAQLDIFDLWIWMAETHPEPLLAAVMAADRSPSREQISAVFGELKAAGELHLREQQPYEAFDHRAVTFATAGLPLWLARDVPDDAVVIYYQDRSGPTIIRDRESGARLGELEAVTSRQWLSIMVPTDVGWLLFRDQLIEPGDPELSVPEEAPPSAGSDRRTPEV